MTRQCTGVVILLLTALCAATSSQQARGQSSASSNAPPGSLPLAAPQLPPEPPFAGRAPYAPEALVPDNPSAPRSVVFDKPKARELNEAQEPSYVTRIDVTATQDLPPAKTKSFEQRFADALTPPVSFLSRHSYSNSTEPCPTLASPGTPFTQSYNVYGFCP
jgi:hypothetical protein